MLQRNETQKQATHVAFVYAIGNRSVLIAIHQVLRNLRTFDYFRVNVLWQCFSTD